MPAYALPTQSQDSDLDDFSNFTPAVVRKSPGTITVEFTDRETGEHFAYQLTTDRDTTGQTTPNASPEYTSTKTSTILNRAETKQFANDSHTKAMLYTIFAALGMKPATLGTIIYSEWSHYASEYYNRGGCIKINYWYTVNFVKLGDRGCF